MKNILFLIILFVSNYSTAQIFSKRPKKIKINYTYTFISTKTDTIKCNRTPQTEWYKLSDIDKDLFVYASLMETSLQNENVKEAEQYLANFKRTLINDNVDINLTNYERELAYYKGQEEKREKEKIISDKIKQKELDSIKISNERQKIIDENKKHINDSIVNVNRKEKLKNEQGQPSKSGLRVESDYITHCISSSSYKYDDGKKEKVINSPATLCFNNFQVAFYTINTGVVTFRVEQPTGAASETGDGGWVFLYISAESNTTPFAFYTLQIYHSKDDKKKTVVFTYSRSGGVSYTFSADNYSVSSDLEQYFNHK